MSDPAPVPRANRTVRAAGKTLHLIAASVVGGGIAACAALLAGRSGVGPETAAGLDRALFLVFTWTIKYPFLVLLATSTFLSSVAGWGFFRHRWVALKWIISAALVAATVLWGAPATEGLAALSDSFRTVDREYAVLTFRAWSFLGALSAAYLAAVLLSVFKPFGSAARADSGPSMRSRSLLSGALVVLSLLPPAFIAANEASLRPARRMPIAHVDLASVPDGAYRGRAKIGSFEYEVEAVVASGRLEAARATVNRASPYARWAEGVLAKAVRYGRNDVDAVTAATTTSKALLKALEKALSEGIR